MKRPLASLAFAFICVVTGGSRPHCKQSVLREELKLFYTAPCLKPSQGRCLWMYMILHNTYSTAHFKNVIITHAIDSKATKTISTTYLKLLNINSFNVCIGKYIKYLQTYCNAHSQLQRKEIKLTNT